MRDNQAGPPVTYAVVPQPATAAVEEARLPPPARQPRVRRRLVLTVLAVAVFVAALLVIGLDGLIPFGLLLAFSTDSDEQETRRSVILTPRNLGLAAAKVAVRCSRGRDHALRFAHADAHGLSHQNVAPLVQCHKQWATT
jgi:anti-sigma factor RsiW